MAFTTTSRPKAYQPSKYRASLWSEGLPALIIPPHLPNYEF